MFTKILVANRGEIAVRLVHAVRDMGLESVAIYAPDDAHALHVQVADHAVALDSGATADARSGASDLAGPRAYLDIPRIIAVAQQTGCDAIHPGYGFLSERADFAQACAQASLGFIGPTPAQLVLFGDKAKARALAQRLQVPLLPGSLQAVSLAEAQAFFAAQQTGAAAGGRGKGAAIGIMVKAIGGGGGRGMRAVMSADALPEAYARCQSEAQSAFGVDGVYVERLMRNARHIEIQILGDGHEVIALGERECSLQLRFQKLVEIAPSPLLAPALRAQITDAALAMARAVNYQGLGTFEFLVDAQSADLPFVFIEANPRLQVEHTVTEAVTGLDLVQLQIGIASGQRLRDLGLDPAQPPTIRGSAIQWRINAETTDASGNARPSGGTVSRFDLPSGPGIRVDTHGFDGCTPSPHYDTLLAKLIVHSPDGFAQAARRARRALAGCHIDGVATNLNLLQAVAARPEFDAQQLHTRFVEEHLVDLLAGSMAFAPESIAVSACGISARGQSAINNAEGGHDQPTVRAPMPARLVQISVKPGELFPAGHPLAVLEAMKMEHLLLADAPGQVLAWCAGPGEFLTEGQPLLRWSPVQAEAVTAPPAVAIDPEHIRPDLVRLRQRQALTLDANRPAAIGKRHAQGGRTARENIADLCGLEDLTTPGNFLEYGALAIAAQTRRRSVEDLMTHTPADGMVTGIGTVNARDFGPEKSRCVVLAYDYTVLAGTQGMRNHHKKDRMLGLAHQLGLPVVLFAEGGGGRPGDTDMPVVAGLNNHTFSQFAALSGKVPVVGIVHGRCFAGNAALLGCSDVIIATVASNIGMGGPAMIEGGGLGSFKPEQIGPSQVQSRNGVIDVLVQDEAEAVQVARRYLSFFQGRLSQWDCPDQRLLRQAIPENRLRVYDIRALMAGLVDTGSLLELRAGFGAGMVTALARIEGAAIGLIANNPLHLGGAIDVEAADKAARFMQLCNAHGLPMVSLMDTPGFMVGPDIEAQAQVRHACRLFVVAAHLDVPFFSVVLRKGYGLGAQAMAAGGFDAPVFTVAWPTGEFGAMGLEGAVRLGFRKELEAAAEGKERDSLFKRLLDEQVRNGEAMNMAATLEIDAVIDPAQTRGWISSGLASAARRRRDPAADRPGRLIDPW